MIYAHKFSETETRIRHINIESTLRGKEIYSADSEINKIEVERTKNI